jgi:hypothetical protein
MADPPAENRAEAPPAHTVRKEMSIKMGRSGRRAKSDMVSTSHSAESARSSLTNKAFTCFTDAPRSAERDEIRPWVAVLDARDDVLSGFCHLRFRSRLSLARTPLRREDLGDLAVASPDHC